MGAVLLPTIRPAHLWSEFCHAVCCRPPGGSHSKVERLMFIIGVLLPKPLDMSPMENNEDDGCNGAWNEHAEKNGHGLGRGTTGRFGGAALCHHMVALRMHSSSAGCVMQRMMPVMW